MTDTNAIGRSIPIRDGQAKITGSVRYATDITLPGMLHARLVTSPYAHARILTIDTSDALNVDGVIAVMTADDLPTLTATNRRRLLLARDRVIFTGQPVALVLAENEAAALDGAELVFVDYEPLMAAVTLDQAMADDAPLVWPGGVPSDDNEAGAHGADLGEDDSKNVISNISGRRNFKRGDIEAGFAEADVIVERTFTTSMIHHSYLEPHATVVQPDPLTGGMVVWTSTQAPFWAREEVAGILNIPESDVRVVGTPVGGGFGGKFVLYEPLLALAARHTNRPIRLVLTRMEEMLAANPAPAARLQVKLGAKQDGTFIALVADLAFEAGCYPGFHGIAALLLGSFYPVPNLDIKFVETMNFKPSVGAYRAPGAPQATFAMESVVDEMARQLAIDPFELRLKNAAKAGDKMAHGRPWSDIGMSQVLETLQAHPAWQNREAARAAGRGIGFAVGGWPGGTEPAAAACMLNRDGQLHIHIGSIDLTGTSTGFALLAADTFGIDPEQVRVVAGDTANAPYAGAAGGSKITYTVGPAIMEAVQDARQQVLEIASEEFEVDPADLEIINGRIQVKGVPDKGLSLAEISSKTMQFAGKYAPIMGRGRYANNNSAAGFCAQLAEVEVDEETGEVKVVNLVIVQDVGQVINPEGIKGQMMGGAVQGLGWALYERMVHDDSGQLLTGTWTEYAVPHFDQSAPNIETIMIEIPSEHGPLGARGVGEPPVVPTAGAVANAIADAIGKRPLHLPIRPSLVRELVTREDRQ